jgi:hypothetical protein
MIFSLGIISKALLALALRAFFLAYVLSAHGIVQVVAAGSNRELTEECAKSLPSSLPSDINTPPEPGLYRYPLQDKRNFLCLKLADVRRDKATPTGPGQWLMHLEIIDKSGDSRPFCLPDREGKTWALAYKEGNGDTKLTCSKGAYAKCLRMGYVPWITYRSVSLARYHKACTMLIRADYLGDGSSHTTAGVSVDISDDLGISTPSPLAVFEGGWDEKGAVCMREWRLPQPQNKKYSSIAASLRGGYGTIACDHENAKKQGAILFSGKLR